MEGSTVAVESNLISTTPWGLLACCQCQFGHHQNGHILIIVPYCLMWCLWRGRNNRCFEDYERSIPDLKLFFFRTFLDWLSALRNQLFSSIFDFLDLVISVFNPVHSLCTRVFLFDINKSYYLSKKKKKRNGKSSSVIIIIPKVSACHIKSTTHGLSIPAIIV